MNRETIPVPEFLTEEATGEGHKLEELYSVKKMVLQEIRDRGVIEGADLYSEENYDRLIWTHALDIIQQAEKWLEKKENNGKTLEEFMIEKERDAIDEYKNEKSLSVKDNDLDSLEDIFFIL